MRLKMKFDDPLNFDSDCPHCNEGWTIYNSQKILCRCVSEEDPDEVPFKKGEFSYEWKDGNRIWWKVDFSMIQESDYCSDSRWNVKIVKNFDYSPECVWTDILEGQGDIPPKLSEALLAWQADVMVSISSGLIEAKKIG